MKAHKSQSRDIILSIGMIVKNEEKVLERSLKSMQPLMKAIPCELIIADTGSTDSTVEIAKKYTDNVFHFEWINDFAAARNSTLEKAKGQWYMFIDADEYFDEDVSEMIHFFKIPELRSQYKTIEIPVRNYKNTDKTIYNDCLLPRFHRIDNPNEPVRFMFSVHEGIGIREPLGRFTTILHHTGYCFSSQQQNLNKKNRNLQLMRQEHEKNPEDLRMLSHLIDGAMYEEEEKVKYISEAIIIAQKRRKDMYSNVVFMQAIMHYQNTDPEYALELCDKYFRTADEPERNVATVGILSVQGSIYASLNRNKLAWDSFKKYFELYDDYINDKLLMTDLSAHPIIGLTRSEYIKNICAMCLVLKRLNEFEKAFELINGLEIEKLDGQDFKTALGTIREICQKEEQYIELARVYEKLIDCDDDNKKELVLYMLESTYYSILGEIKREKFANDIIKSGVSGRYPKLMKLLLNQNDSDFEKKLTELLDSIDNWKEGYSEAIYLAVKYKIDISSYVDRMNTSEFRSKLELIASNHDDFAGYVLDYGIPECFTLSIKRFYWITTLYEKASYKSFLLSDDRKYELYMRFTNLMGDYVSNIYNSELLEDESDVEVLSSLHKFGYYMKKANNALVNDEDVEYIRELRKALVNCESMKEIVQFLLEHFKKQKGM